MALFDRIVSIGGQRPWGSVIIRQREQRETMQRIVMLGAALVAALSIAAVGAETVSATGHEFVASKTGKTNGKQDNPQIFKTGAGTLECDTVTSTGDITELKSAIHKETLTYSNCSAFGYPSVKITPVHFEYSANESARLETAVTITPEGAGCHITIPVQTVEGISYENKPAKEITASANVSGIRSKGSGSGCGSEENSEGSYTGSVTAELEGGSVEWK
jgi:hypothetical protein